ncbi:MAG: gliding motility-associated C-terminal domain-containing protein [Bacteroidales bacterium]|nr:gliding motility-associated C-terminal domain-containing protein [Bacteroidales bacterium]
MYRIFFLIVVVNLLAVLPGKAQPYPEEPELYSVTVDVETGYDIIVWYRTPSDFADYYKVVITYDNDGDPTTPTNSSMETGDPVYVPDTVFTNPNSGSQLGSVGYSVVAVNDLGGGIIFKSNWHYPDSTVFLESEYDSCQGFISLSWNDYNNWRGSIARYNIYRRLGPGMYQMVATLGEGTNTYEIANVVANQDYDLFVEVEHQDGRRSTSNRTHIVTSMLQQTGPINADYATISPGNAIDLSFTIDGTTGMHTYYLMRSENTAGNFSQVTEINTSDALIRYTDDIPFTSGVYYYRLDVKNNCGTFSAGSNMANNIVLSGSRTGMQVALTWNEYTDWDGGVQQYRVIRKQGRILLLVDTVSIGITQTYTDDLSSLVDYENPQSSLVCYEVQAVENLNSFGIQGKSLSNRVCFSVFPNIRMPDAFIPNDPEPMNQSFEPVFSFLPERYRMIIYNRLGTKIWEGSDAWDGKVNGKFVPEGVYVYYLRVYNYSTDVTELNGKVTVLYR